MDFLMTVGKKLWAGVTAPTWTNPWTWGAVVVAAAFAGWLFTR